MAVGFENLKEMLEREGIQLEEQKAEIRYNDSDIKGGRRIVNVKSNQLFTGQFEKNDVDTFISIWKQYTPGNVRSLCSSLFKACKAVNTNYRKEVCPFEVMLYTSNIISSSFNNPNLIEDVADVIYQIWNETNDYIQSLAHIIKTWKWLHIKNICAVAAGKIGDSELLRYVYDNFRFEEETRLCCFLGLLESRKEEFVPEILVMVRDLDGSLDVDRRMGNKFKEKFGSYFPETYGQLSASMFEKSSGYVKSLVSKMIVDGGDSFQGRYASAKGLGEKKAIIEEGFNKLFNSAEGPGMYDVINMFKTAHNNEVSERLYEKMDLNHEQGIRKSTVVATISYFNTVYHENALKRLANVKPDNSYYAAARLALYHQGKITSDELMSGFLSERRTDQLKIYLSGFYGMSKRGNEIQDSTFSYFSKDLGREALSVGIANYEKLIRKYRHLYDSDMISLICEWFGYNTVFKTSRISLADQTACLNIIEKVINSANYKKYQDFLYYVAEEGTSFNYTVSSKASQILKNMPVTLEKLH